MARRHSRGTAAVAPRALTYGLELFGVTRTWQKILMQQVLPGKLLTLRSICISLVLGSGASAKEAQELLAMSNSF